MRLELAYCIGNLKIFEIYHASEAFPEAWPFFHDPLLTLPAVVRLPPLWSDDDGDAKAGKLVEGLYRTSGMTRRSRMACAAYLGQPVAWKVRVTDLWRARRPQQARARLLSVRCPCTWPRTQSR